MLPAAVRLQVDFPTQLSTSHQRQQQPCPSRAGCFCHRYCAKDQQEKQRMLDDQLAAAASDSAAATADATVLSILRGR